MADDGWTPVAGADAAPADDGWTPITAAPQVTGPARIPAMVASNAAEGATTLLGIPGDIQTYANKGMNWLGNTLVKTITGKPIPQAVLDAQDKYAPGIFNSQQLTKWGQQLGFWNRPDLEPQTTAEKYIAAGSRGVGAALPLAFGDGVAIAPVVKAVAQGAGAGIGAQAGADASPNHPIIAPLAGAAAGALAGGGLVNAGAKVASTIAGDVSPTVQAYNSAGVTPRLAGDVTGNGPLQWIQAGAAHLPGGGGIEKAAHQTVNEFGNAVDGTAASLGQATTPQQAGAALQTGARDWIANVAPAKHAAAWAPMNAAVPSDTPVFLNNYRGALNKISANVGRISTSADALQPGLAGTLKDALSTDLGGKPATWDETQFLRSLVGEARGNPGLVEQMGDQNLSKLYAGLSQDMRVATKRLDTDNAVTGGATRRDAVRGSTPITDAFDNANRASTGLYNFQQNVLGNIITSKNPLQERLDPGLVANRLLNSGKTGDYLLGQLRSEMPQAADELGAFKLRDMALANAGTQNAGGTTISPGSFLTGYNKLTPEARTALWSSSNTSGKVQALAKVAESMKATAAKLNTSKTQSQGQWAHMMSGGAALEGFHKAGIPGAVAGLVAPAVPGIVGSALTSTAPLTRFMAAPGLDVSPAVSRLTGAAGVYGSLPDQGRGRGFFGSMTPPQ